MAGALEDFADRALLDQFAGIHYADPVADLLDHGEVVADEQDGGLKLAAQVLEQVQDIGLDGGVQGGGRLVQHQKRRVGRQGHRDHDALLHAAGKLVGVEGGDAGGFGNADFAQHFQCGLDAVGGAGHGGGGRLPPPARRRGWSG